MDRLEPRTSLLLVVDVQERLMAAIPPAAAERAVKNTRMLLAAAQRLGVAVLASEQNPKGLGPTVAPLAEMLRAIGVEPADKLTFDACGDPHIADGIARHAPRAVVIAGVEAHVCVFQTVRELAHRGLDVRVVADAVASRTEDNRLLGLALCARAGAIPMPAESVVFDWLGRAGTDEFRAVSKLVK